MSRRLNRVGLLLFSFLASEVWALGLGDIRLDSALNEPLRAEIELLSATPEDLESLRINLAGADTFERYGLDRPVFLSRIDFDVQQTAGGARVRLTSNQPVTEPFITFLVEASWPSGRLLREYTLLLDPPTFAPPPGTPRNEAVAAPQRASQADRGQIERAPAPAPREPASRQAADRPADDSGRSFDTSRGDDYQVQRGDTLWRIAERVKPDGRLTMNQTMIAIYESNPDAFAGNINVLRANSRLRIPSADDIFRISRGDALNKMQAENDAWAGGRAASGAREPSLTLVPPDRDQDAYRGGTSTAEDGQRTDAAATSRIRDLEAQVAEQESLLEVRDNELAQLRAELQRLREERAAAGDTPADDAAEPAPADDAATEPGDEIFVEDDTPPAGDEVPADDAAADDEPAVDDAATAEPAPRVAERRDAPGLIDRVIDALTGVWGLIGLALLVVLGVLVWFARRAAGGDDTDSTGVWDALDADDVDSESVASTERLRAMARDDDTSIVVVEQGAGDATARTRSREEPALTEPVPESSADFRDESLEETGTPVSLEDTFSSDTAINLDQSDPIAEADFHMAYGLYDQAADLINGALAVEPDRKDLIGKLCEIYFVWGNRDAFVESANRYKAAIGDQPDADWDKIVIMGQQIAGDDPLFAQGAGGGAAQDVDLAFDEGGEESALDMDFAGGPDGAVSDVIDLGDDSDSAADIFGGDDDDGLDFSFDDDIDDTSESITREMPGSGDEDSTVESPTIETEAGEATTESPTIETEAADTTMESPTIEQRLDRGDADRTSELPTLSDDEPSGQWGRSDARSDATAEINVDDLGLDLESLAGDLGADDMLSDLDETGTQEGMDDTQARTDVDVQGTDGLLDATGETQVLPDDFSLDTGNRKVDDLTDNDATMLAPGPGEEPDFDFAETEALPKDSFERDRGDETGEMPGLAGSTDMDLDLDDLTAALKISEGGDTVNQTRDDATVEQPGPAADDLDFDLGIDDGDSEDPTQSLSPDDVSDDLQDARTMTEVGTKLDLARAYVDMGDPGGARNILEEVLDEGDESQRQQAQQLLDSLPG